MSPIGSWQWRVAAPVFTATLLASALLVAGCGGSDEAAVAQDAPSVRGPATSAALSPPSPPTAAATEAKKTTAGERIVFARSKVTDALGVYTMNPDGTDIERVWRPRDSDLGREVVIAAPRFSPDATRIVFSVSGRFGSADERSGRMYIMDADGEDLRRLTTGGFDDYGPTFSPDGQQIAFSRDGALHVMPVDGGGSPTRITDGPHHGAPRFSPDGDRLVFVASRPLPPEPDGPDNAGESVTDEIDTVDVAGTEEPRRLTRHDTIGGDAHPSYSPDGRWIVFTREIGARSADVWVMRADGSQAHRVSRGPGFEADRDPAYAPDGSRIVFTRFRGDEETGAYDLFTMKPDGTDASALTDTDEIDEDAPHWVAGAN